MIKVGLTGNMGSGKSTVAKIFNILGVPIFYADFEAKKILDQQHTILKLEKQFGSKVIDKQGKIQRDVLATIVFNHPASLKFLNELIHPEVEQAFTSWAEEHKDSTYIIHEAAILFESGFDQYMDEVIYVFAPKDVRINRIIKRDKLSLEKVQQRIKNQWDDFKKTNLSNHIINNGIDDLLIPQVLKINKAYNFLI